MTELFREREFAVIGYYRSILESHSIPTIVKNETLTMSGLSEIPIPDFYPALCVVNDEDKDRALAILREYVMADHTKSEEEIACASCGEMNPGNFDLCWSCGGEIRTETV